MVYPAPPPPKTPKKKSKLNLSPRLFKPLAYIGMAIFVLILGIFIPGITDEIVLETLLILVAAYIEIKSKIDAPKK